MALTTADGDELTARFVIGATGVFTQPKPPEIPGLDDFAGDVMHTVALGSRPRPQRQAGGDRRHRRLGRPGGAGDRAGRSST